jgi:RNA polymerase sigma-70 factor, ECF subfamily
MSSNRAAFAAMDASREAHLVGTAQTGDRGSFMELVRHYQAPLYRLLYAMRTNEAEAAALVQETFARAWKGIAEYPSGRRFFPWILRIARALPPKPGVARSPEAGEPLLRTLDALRPDDRMALALRVVEGISYREIAALLDVPTGLVILRIAQARGSLLAGAGTLEARPA